MKKSIGFVMILMILTVSLQGCVKKISTENQISSILKTKIIAGDIIKNEDTHGGFHGDGDRIVVIKYNNDAANSMLANIKDNQKWSALPLNENLNLLMYGRLKGNTYFGYELAKKAGIPKIEHGYYCFVNKQTNGQEITILGSPSLNFAIAMFDTDNHIIYFLEQDS